MAGDTHGYWLAKHAAPRRNISAARGDAIFVIASASDEAISHFRSLDETERLRATKIPAIQFDSCELFLVKAKSNESLLLNNFKGNQIMIRQTLIFAFVCTFLTGCTVGTKFERPNEETLVLGVTTRQDVEAKFGKPRSQRDATGIKKKLSNGTEAELDPTLRDARFKFLSYVFSDRTMQVLLGNMQGISPAKQLDLSFVNDKLYFYRFISTFKNEANDFNEESIPKVERNVTKLSEIKKALGEPTGRGIYPHTDYPDQRAYLYQYFEIESGSSLVKTAVFFTDLDDTITDYRFNATTENR